VKIGILGSGLMGGKLGTIWARAGHEVVFSYSRRYEKLEALARKAGDNARAGTPDEAAEAADVVFIAVNWPQLADVLGQAGELSGTVIVTCSLPMNADDSDLAVGHTSSGSEQLAAMVPGGQVVAAFNTVPSEVLFDVFEGQNDDAPPSLVYCGDDAGAKRVASELIRDAGFDPIDAGALRLARYTEPLGVLVGALAYGGTKGPEMAYRFEWFEPRQ